jgi:hypothetical protein
MSTPEQTFAEWCNRLLSEGRPMPVTLTEHQRRIWQAVKDGRQLVILKHGRGK